MKPLQINPIVPIEVGGRKMLVKANLTVLQFGSIAPMYDLKIEDWTAYDDKASSVCSPEHRMRECDCNQPTLCTAIAFEIGKYAAENQHRLLAQ